MFTVISKYMVYGTAENITVDNMRLVILYRLILNQTQNIAVTATIQIHTRTFIL